MAKRWTEEEKQYLIDNYEELGAKGCAEYLGRTPSAVMGCIFRYELKTTSKSCNKKRNEKAANDYKRLVEKEGFILLEEYVKAHNKLNHRCEICEYIWNVAPTNFKKLMGCPSCNSKKDLTNAITYVYLCKFPILGLKKIGITYDWDKRKTSFGYEAQLLQLVPFSNRAEALEFEKLALETIKDNLLNTGELRDGNTETFYDGT